MSYPKGSVISYDYKVKHQELGLTVCMKNSTPHRFPTPTFQHHQHSTHVRQNSRMLIVKQCLNSTCSILRLGWPVSEVRLLFEIVACVLVKIPQGHSFSFFLGKLLIVLFKLLRHLIFATMPNAPIIAHVLRSCPSASASHLFKILLTSTVLFQG